MDYRIKPRPEWEMVPMFSDEIVVSPDFVECSNSQKSDTSVERLKLQ